MQKTLIFALVTVLAVSASIASATYYGAVGISPTSRTINSGESVTFTAWGGDGAYSWSVPNGNPSSGWGSSFTTSFYNYGSSALFQEVVVTSGGSSAYAWITVLPSVTPTPTPWYGNVTIDHTVRNVTHGGSDATWVSASNGDRLQFTVRITTDNQYAEDVHVRDWLPQYVSYLSGSTTLDGSWYQDGVATGGPNDSLALGTLSPNRTYVLRFEADVNSAPNTTLTNTVNIHVRGFVDQTRTSTITVSGSYYTPTPTPTPIIGGDHLALSIVGRNVTRGQSGEHSSLSARGGDTLDLILRIRSQNGQYLYNVIVTDYLPVGIAYIPGSTALNGQVTTDGITSSGLNIGTLAPWQEATVKFSVRVDEAFVPTVGRTTITNTAQARADGTATVGSSIALTLGVRQILAAAGVKTGPADTLAMALGLALVVTGGYAAYARTSVFNRRMATAEVKVLAGKPLNFSR
jgi:uncharacterized repeat protein (TIGR01451 family)